MAFNRNRDGFMEGDNRGTFLLSPSLFVLLLTSVGNTTGIIALRNLLKIMKCLIISDFLIYLNIKPHETIAHKVCCL